MGINLIVGINWGDEGKGRMVDYLADNTDAVVRFQGGNNAGHTVVNERGRFALHLIPSGIFHKSVLNVLGTGMTINIEALCDEISKLEDRGINCENLKISDRATICFPFYGLEDEFEEDRLGENAYGSTKVGIAPAYGDRYRKKSIQIGELLNPSKLKEKLKPVVEYKNNIFCNFYKKDINLQVDDIMDWLELYGSKIKNNITDTSSLLRKYASQNQNILLEAQLGALRDIYYGIYPFTSSSHCVTSFAKIGAGLFGHQFSSIIGVMKAFSTCVGSGPFVTEMELKIADSLREFSFEYGAKTGRPRRIGFFDVVASKYGVMVQEANQLALTKLDCLSGIDPLKICVGYKHNDKIITSFPLNYILEDCEPQYIEMKGWSEDISGIREMKDLPLEAINYVNKIEELVKCPIKYISVGPERQQLIIR